MITMPKNKELVKVHSRAPRFRENTRLMRVHESMVDFLKGAPPSGSLLDVMASSFFGLDILNIDEENDLIYSDDDDDEVLPQDPYNQLAPHPRIKQLTDEEAEKQAKELIEEEERKGRKKKKNKHKKLRKKEKKRLEKENAEKVNLPEEEQEKSDSSESPEETPIVEKKTESKEKESTPVSDKPGTEPGCDELSKINEEVEEPQKNNKDQEEASENTELNPSYPSNTESVAEETHQYTQETKEEKSETVEDEEEKAEVTEEPEAGKEEEEEEKGHTMKEMKQDVIKEQEPMDPAVLEFAQRSRDLAAVGNRLAATGQYEMAVKYFTDAIKYNPRETRLFGNRSLCFERMHQYENALSDAEVALTMEPNWTKGLFRKGKALCGLKKYYEASLVYKDVLKLDSLSKEAMQELKRAQTLHLMEMGFTWAQSCDALKTHGTLEEAIEALFCGRRSLASGGTGAGVDSPIWGPMQEGGSAETEWTVQQTSRPRTQHAKESSSQNQPTPVPKSSTKPQVFSVWVGSMAPTITYTILHEVFSRAGTVCSIKMLLEHKCAFVNYAKKKESDRAIQCINGMVVEGVPLLVRYPSRNHTGLSVPKWATGDPSAPSGPGMYKKECFFWRTTGCIRDNCDYRHVPEHKGIDKDKFTSGLGTTFT